MHMRLFKWRVLDSEGNEHRDIWAESAEAAKRKVESRSFFRVKATDAWRMA